ncbi:RNA-binding protein 12-like [Pelobates fuscus]|uniref:RNA-binding protein 12-like n=1 Tax=Pelobates fuscus TaxID=191477 RepID=UPI002FE4E7E4
MTVFVRLRGLPVVANSMDVRQFFFGLSIPRGGVYIIGGVYGEAFITFGSFEDARCALNLSGRPLKNSIVHLSLSSEAEMRYAFEINRITANQPMQSIPYPGFGNGADRNGIHPYSRLRSEERAGPSYLYLHSLPLKATKVEIKEYFKELYVEDVIFLKFQNGVRNGNAVVKFSRSNDAIEALQRPRLFMGSCQINMMVSDELEWIRAGGIRKKELSPRRSLSSGRKRSRSRSPVRKRRHAVYTNEFYVHLVHLPTSAAKKDVQQHFSFASLSESQITFLTDKSGKRTREGFVMFKCGRDYKRALDLHKEPFLGRSLSIYSIPKRAMQDLLSHKEGKSSNSRERSAQIDFPRRNAKESPSWKANCVYLRNFSFDVTKADVQKFLTGFTVKEEDIFVLVDDKGVGLGEALVKFETEKEAASVGKLHREKYNGTEILLRCITEEQMKAFGAGNRKLKDAGEAIATDAAAGEPATDAAAGAIATDTAAGEPATDTAAGAIATDTAAGEPATDTAAGEPATDTAAGEPATDTAAGEPATDTTAGEPATDTAAGEPATDTAAGEPATDPEEIESMEVTTDTQVPSPDLSQMVAPSDVTNIEDESACEVDNNETNAKESLEEEGTCENSHDGKQNETTVFIRNVPNTVTVPEIQDFFVAYKVFSVNLTQIDTGTATVCLQTYEEALCAVNELDNRPIGNNTVTLSLV